MAKNNGLNLPDFMVIGAARSGTTTLYEYLQQHPDIIMSTVKEPAFFAVDEFYNKGIEWYSSLFKNIAGQQLCGEASTYYTVDPYTPIAAKRIYERLPHVKLIYIMRSPIDRLYSHYVWEVCCAQRENNVYDISLIPLDEDGFFQKPKEGWKPWKFATKFEKSLEASPGFYINTSQYIKNIKEYLKYFPREALLCLFFEDLKKNPGAILNQIYTFLKVRPIPLKKFIIANQAKDQQDKMVYHQLKKKLFGVTDVRQTRFHWLIRAMPPSIRQAILALLVRTSLGQQTVKNIEKKLFVKPLSSETRAKLMREFKEANQELSEFLDRDLSYWNE
jgi:hypothetical protein